MQIDKDASYSKFGEAEEFYVVISPPGTENPERLLDAAEATPEDEEAVLKVGLPKIRGTILEVRLIQ